MLLGETLALLTAVAWALAVILFRQSGAVLAPLALNVFKNVVGLGCLALTLALALLINIKGVWPQAPWQVYVGLLASGMGGIAMADTLFFASLNRLGASGAAIVECLYAPSILLFAFVLLGERVGWQAWLGAALILLSVFLAAQASTRTVHEAAERRLGLIYGVLAMVLMGVSLVAVKAHIETYPLLWTTTLRLFGGTLALFVVAMISGERRHVLAAFRPQPIWRVAVPAALLGTYIALLLWLGGFKYTSASVASLLNQTSTVFTVLFAAWILKETLSRRRLLALGFGFGGSLLVLLSSP